MFLILAVFSLMQDRTSPSLSAGPMETAEPQVCTTYSYPEYTFFGKDEATIRADFPGCEWSRPENVSDVLKFYKNPPTWYSADLGWWMGSPAFPSILEAWQVKCPCWTSLEHIRVVFHRVDDDITRLVAVEKRFKVPGDSFTFFVTMTTEIKRKAGFSATIEKDLWSPPGAGPGEGWSAATARWNGKSQDLILAGYEMLAGLGTVESLTIHKGEWSKYRTHLNQIRQAAQEQQQQQGTKAASEL